MIKETNWNKSFFWNFIILNFFAFVSGFSICYNSVIDGNTHGKYCTNFRQIYLFFL